MTHIRQVWTIVKSPVLSLDDTWLGQTHTQIAGSVLLAGALMSMLIPLATSARSRHLIDGAKVKDVGTELETGHVKEESLLGDVTL